MALIGKEAYKDVDEFFGILEMAVSLEVCPTVSSNVALKAGSSKQGKTLRADLHIKETVDVIREIPKSIYRM